MLKLLPLIAFALFISTATGGEKPPDITGANKKTLDAHLGKVVSLRGTLDLGMQGEIIRGATRRGDFYIIADVPPGGFTLPESWMQLRGHKVRVTGELKFRSFDHTHAKPEDQIPPDYYYMVLQRTEIQRLDSK
jgi:hypothetical protein